MVHAAGENDISEAFEVDEVFCGANGRESKEIVKPSTDCRHCHRGSVKPLLKGDRIGWQARESSFTALTTLASPLLREKTGSAMDTGPGPFLPERDNV